MLISPEIFNLLSIQSDNEAWLGCIGTSPAFYAHMAETYGSLRPSDWPLEKISLGDEFKEYSRDTAKLEGNALVGYLTFLDGIDNSSVQAYCCGQFYFSVRDNHQNLVNTREAIDDPCEFMFNMFLAGIQLGSHGRPLANQLAQELNNNVKDRLAQIYATAVTFI